MRSMVEGYSSRGGRDYPSTTFADGCYAAGSGSRHAPGMPTRLHPLPILADGEAGV
jgi:hypothetical protein